MPVIKINPEISQLFKQQDIFFWCFAKKDLQTIII